MPDLGLDIRLLLHDLQFVLIAFLLAVPIGWERGRGPHSAGFRTLPVVAMASCGFAMIIEMEAAAADTEAQARVLQGVIAGIGFIGGGAIIKHGRDVQGLATAASIWNAGAIGGAVGFGRLNIAILLSLINLLGLWLLAGLNVQDEEDED